MLLKGGTESLMLYDDRGIVPSANRIEFRVGDEPQTIELPHRERGETRISIDGPFNE